MTQLKRSHWCQEGQATSVGSTLTLAGWVDGWRDHGGIIFIDLRDRTGILQLVFDPKKDAELGALGHRLRSEDVIMVTGTLVKRAPAAVNPNLPTGSCELVVEQCQLLNKAETLPFQLGDDKVSEELRLKYRYLDLRRPVMQKALKLRHEVIFAMREFLNTRDFYEIETPILTRSTPGGALDYLVPSRTQTGSWYALPQSPQIYKQLLIVGGLERYFQVARCFRDEALRANRQPEFTQLDLELSFVDEEDIYSLCEDLLSLLLKKFLSIDMKAPFKRYTFDEVFERYGSDKPDTRFELEVRRVTKLFESVELSFLQSIIASGGVVGGLCVKNYAFTRSELDGWVERAKKEFGAKGLMYIRFEDKQPRGPIAKFLPDDFFDRAVKFFPDLTSADTLFFIGDTYEVAWDLLGKLRLEFGKALHLINKSLHHMFWVTDFPMFEYDRDNKRWAARHHPFTSPQASVLATPHWEQGDLGSIKARAYDLVYNGEELGGGSIRIHDAEVQQKIFSILGILPDQARQKFGYLLDAQKYGYPPDGGIAFGIDRLIMMFMGTESIRDVIAFPKTQKGSCLMMEAPSSVDVGHLRELGIRGIKQEAAVSKNA